MLIKYLKNKHKIQKKHVLGHSHIAPGRKADPGIHFPWKKLSNQKLSNNH
jgi:N-acetyl-anhydromuramyl-L-alanine amidase AmpD